MAILNFNAQTVDPNTAFDPLPAGWYHVKIESSESKPTSKGGAMLAMVLVVLDGEYAGRKVFYNLNIENSNPVAVEIAYKELSALCYVTGQLQIADSQQLHDIPFQAKLSVRAATEQYDASNDVKGVRSQDGRDPKDMVSGGGAAPAGAQAPAQPGTPPAQPATAAPTKPTDPAHIHAAGTPDEMWWLNGEWVKAPEQAAAPPPSPSPAAAPQPPAAPDGGNAPAAQPAAPAQPEQPATPPAAPAAAGNAPTPPWSNQPAG